MLHEREKRTDTDERRSMGSSNPNMLQVETGGRQLSKLSLSRSSRSSRSVFTPTLHSVGENDTWDEHHRFFKDDEWEKYVQSFVAGNNSPGGGSGVFHHYSSSVAFENDDCDSENGWEIEDTELAENQETFDELAFRRGYV